MQAKAAQRLIDSARPAAWLFVGALISSAAWLMWLDVTGESPPISFVIGVSVSGLILGGVRLWPVVVLSVFASFLLIEPSRPLVSQALPSLTIPAGALLTAVLIRQRDVRPAELLDPHSLLWVLAAAAAGSTLTALLGMLGGWVLGLNHTLPHEFLDRFARNGLGMMLAAPLVLVWATSPRDHWSRVRWAGFLATMLLCAATATGVFLVANTAPISWAIFPPLVLAALGWHLRGATTAMAICAVIILWSTGTDTGPFASSDPPSRIHLAQMFVAVTCATIFLLATYADERHAEDKLRLAAARLEASRSNLTNMVRDAAMALAILDRDMRYVATSRRYIRDHRLPEDTALEGRSHYEIFADCSDEEREVHRRVQAGEQLSGDADQRRHSDGSIDYVRWSHRPWFDEDNRIAGIILSSEVITAELEARQKLEQAEQRYRAVFEQAGVGVALISLEGCFLEVNDQICALTGRGRANLVGASFRTVCDPAECDSVIRAIEALAQGKAAFYSADRKLLAADGTLVPVHCTANLIRSGDGMPDHVIAVLQDISERIHAEEQLREAHDKLLRVARLNAMGAMASTLAHELNQPLAAITNYLEASRYLTRSHPEPDAAVLDALNQARMQALRAGDIIRKIRSFTVTGEISQAQLDIETVIRSACGAVRQLRVAKGTTIECGFELKPSPSALLGDALQIEQVVHNLVRNAVEATSGCPRREVLVSTHMGKHILLVQVADTGPGLSEAMIENLFEPFRTTKESGTGLGLPICRTIVEAHGGRLWAENDPAGGALFNFTLPVGDSASPGKVLSDGATS